MTLASPSRRFVVLSLLAGACSASPALAAEKKREDRKKGGGASYIQIPMLSFFTTIGRRHGVFTVEMGLDIPDEKLRAKVETYLPRLRDAYLTRLQAYALTLSSDGMVDTEYVRRELQMATDATLKASGASVLLGSLMIS